jgi:hypothetical protein
VYYTVYGIYCTALHKHVQLKNGGACPGWLLEDTKLTSVQRVLGGVG